MKGIDSKKKAVIKKDWGWISDDREWEREGKEEIRHLNAVDPKKPDQLEERKSEEKRSLEKIEGIQRGTRRQ